MTYVHIYLRIYVSRYRSTFVSMKTVLSAVKRLNKGESLKKGSLGMGKNWEKLRLGISADSFLYSDYVVSIFTFLDHFKEIKLEILDNEFLNVENSNLVTYNQSKGVYVKKDKCISIYVKIMIICLLFKKPLTYELLFQIK